MYIFIYMCVVVNTNRRHRPYVRPVLCGTSRKPHVLHLGPRTRVSSPMLQELRFFFTKRCDRKIQGFQDPKADVVSLSLCERNTPNPERCRLAYDARRSIVTGPPAHWPESWETRPRPLNWRQHVFEGLRGKTKIPYG